MPEPASFDQGAAIEADRLTVVHGGHVALRDATFEVARGRWVAIVGPNGSGKSTLLDAVAGLQTPTSGSVRVLGHAPGEVHTTMAYVLQSHALNEHLPATVAEVVAMGRYAGRGAFGRFDVVDRQAVTHALERMQVVDLRNRHLGELSGGQRQRVFVAQGLAQEAEVLLLDEPVTGLDLVSRQLIIDAVREELSRGRTVLMTTHDLGEAADTDQVLLLAGRLVATGSPEAVLTGANLREAYGGRLVDLGGRLSILDDPHHHAVGDDHTGHVH